ncbi:MAG: Fe-S cluster assembly protein SufD [Bacteroidales bacterium]|nr:Fe-S cluster assembly protein SufD [Bacteroidales bacterium]
MENNYIYIPDKCQQGEVEFKCRVPMEDTDQVFVVDGMGEQRGLNLGKGEVLPKMLQVIQVRSSQAAEDLSYSTDYILAEGAQAKVLLCSHTLSLQDFVTHEDVVIKMGERAILDMVVMQNEHNKSKHSTSFKVDMAAGAVLNLNVITLHGGEISNSIDIELNGKGGECNVNGLYLADGTQKVSTKVNIFHNVPECHSSQLFKGILDGESKTSFSGRIYVAKDAQKTEAYQANNNLLASRTAKAYTQPHLEIYADDVKCSHGATVGSLNEDELFYMRSRGIAKDEAKLLQQQAFAYAVLEKVGNANLRERLHSMVERRLRGEFSECSNCSKHCC